MSADQPQKVINSTRDDSSRGVLAEVIANRGFVVCTALLLTFAIGYYALTVGKNVQFRKLPVPLKKALDLLDHGKLGPYRFVNAYQIVPQVLDALGTKDYIQWDLEDTSIEDRSAAERLVSLFVTYYTGKPDQVPHVPEECYSGAGLRAMDANLDYVRIPQIGQEIPVKIIEFEDSSRLRKESRLVTYTFNTNGRFCPDRQCVRIALSDLWSKHAYFSKLEVTFGRPGAYPSKEKAIEAGKRFLQVVIPVLLEDHWPNWDAVVQAEKAEEKEKAR